VNDTTHIPPAKIKYDAKKRATEICPFDPVELKEKPLFECTECRLQKPFDMFNSGTDTVCSSCRNSQAERELKQFKDKEFDKATKVIVGGAVLCDYSRLEHIEHFLSELMDNFGGARVFTRQWYEHLQTAMVQRPGSKLVLDQFRSIAKLVMDTNKLQHQESLADMSDQQLKAKKELLILDVMSEVVSDPGKLQMLIAAARATSDNISEHPLLQQAETIDHAGSTED